MTNQDIRRILTGFISFEEYRSSLLQTRRLLGQRAFHISTSNELESASHEGKADLKHVLVSFLMGPGMYALLQITNKSTHSNRVLSQIQTRL
jgi:hypothetical protein